jgi:hypothetical protein
MRRSSRAGLRSAVGRLVERTSYLLARPPVLVGRMVGLTLGIVYRVPEWVALADLIGFGQVPYSGDLFRTDKPHQVAHVAALPRLLILQVSQIKSSTVGSS